MESDVTSQKANNVNAENELAMSPQVAKPYIVDMMEQLMLLAQSANLKHIANGLDTLLEPYRE